MSHSRSIVSAGNLTITGGDLILGDYHPTPEVTVTGDGIYTINGKRYKTDQLQIRTEYIIKSTGVKVYGPPGDLKIELHGERISVDVDSKQGNVEIHSDSSLKVTNVRTANGNVKIVGNVQNVKTLSGNVIVEGTLENKN